GVAGAAAAGTTGRSAERCGAAISANVHRGGAHKKAAGAIIQAIAPIANRVSAISAGETGSSAERGCLRGRRNMTVRSTPPVRLDQGCRHCRRLRGGLPRRDAALCSFLVAGDGGRMSKGKATEATWRDTARTVALAGLLFVGVRTAVAEPFHVPSESMEP